MVSFGSFIVAMAFSKVACDGLYERACSAVITQSKGMASLREVFAKSSSSVLLTMASLQCRFSRRSESTVSGNGGQWPSDAPSASTSTWFCGTPRRRARPRITPRNTSRYEM